MKAYLLALAALTCGFSSTLLLAQAPPPPAREGTRPLGPPPPGTPPSPGTPGAPGGERVRFVPPLMGAIDINQDGTIDSDEIGKASESLKKLDKNSDGKITSDELRPQRVGNPSPPARPQPPGAPTTPGGQSQPRPPKP